MPDAIVLQAAEPKPIGVFFSYATEDADIVDQFALAFQLLRENLGNNVVIFRDRTSIKPGDIIAEDTKAALRFSEYFIVFYTGRLKKSHSWTGVELGFYQSFEDGDGIPHAARTRHIVPVYVGEPPTVLDDKLGINLKLSSTELSMKREDFIAAAKAKSLNAQATNSLSQLFKEIARQSVERFPEHGLDADGREVALVKRIELIDDHIVPDIWTGMYDCLGSRVARRTIEQRLLEFEIDGSLAKGLMAGIPSGAAITDHNALELFGFDKAAEKLTWAEYTAELERSFGIESAAIRRAIERVFETAVSSITSVDNDQIVRSPVNQRLYRVIVTRHFDYYNGNKIVHVYFIELRRGEEYGEQDTSILLAFVNVTARYRQLFLEARSELSLPAFKILRASSSFRTFQSRVHRLMQELLLIEDEAERLKLNGPAASAALWGADTNYDVVGQMNCDWDGVRSTIKIAADSVLAADPTSDAFKDVRRRWLEALSDFIEVTKKLNASIGGQALDRLSLFYKPVAETAAVEQPAAPHDEAAAARVESASRLPSNGRGTTPL